MSRSMKLVCSAVFLFAVILQFSEVSAGMTCNALLGITFTCPVLTQSDDFCCYTSNNVPYCCNLQDYISNNSAIVGGVIVAAIILLVIITLCSCCCCSCCLLAKRRQQRGTIIYGPVSSQAQPNLMPPGYASAYPLGPAVVHAPPPPPQHPHQHPHPHPSSAFPRPMADQAAYNPAYAQSQKF